MVHLLFAFICLMWGASFMLMKHALTAFGPIGVGTGRVLLGALALVVVWRLWLHSYRVHRANVLPMMLVAVLGYALPFALQPTVIGFVEASAGHGSTLVGMMVALVPLFTVIVSVPILGVFPTARQLTGVLGGLVFLAVLFVDEWRQDVAVTHLLMGVATPISYALSNVYVKRRLGEVPAVVLATMTLAMAGMVLLPLSAGFETVAVGHDQFLSAVVALAVLGLMGTGVAHCLFYVLIVREGPLFAGMVSYVIPCVAMLIGWMFGELLTLWQVVCLVGILSMVWLVQSKPGGGLAPSAVATRGAG